MVFYQTLQALLEEFQDIFYGRSDKKEESKNTNITLLIFYS